MPKLPIVKSNDLVRALERLGFFKHRQRSSSHLIMVHVDGRRTVIPMHSGKDVPKGTLKAILRDTEITTESLIENL
jgi:predicted RNA binding protein YcfA (HicA-like mRNA interferase family)